MNVERHEIEAFNSIITDSMCYRVYVSGQTRNDMDNTFNYMRKLESEAPRFWEAIGFLCEQVKRA